MFSTLRKNFGFTTITQTLHDHLGRKLYQTPNLILNVKCTLYDYSVIQRRGLKVIPKRYTGPLFRAGLTNLIILKTLDTLLL